FEAFSLPYLTRIVSELKGTGVPVILFGTSMSTLLPLMKRTGADVLGLDWRIQMDDARGILGPEVAVQGNLDPLALFLPPEALELGRVVVQELIERADLDPESIDQVVFGQVIPTLLMPSIAREVVLAAGLPRKIEAHTVARACATSIQALVTAAQSIALGHAE